MGKQTKKPQQNQKAASNHRVFDQKFKVAAAKRLLAGESGTQLSRELQVRRSVLYRWREAYRQHGAAGLNRQRGRPPGPGRRPATPRNADPAARRIAELERKVGQQTLEIDFLQRAFKRVKELGPPSGGSGASGSTAKSAPGSALKDE